VSDANEFSSWLVIYFRERRIVIRWVVIFFGRRRVAVPRAFDFGAEFQDVFETAKIELRVFGESAGTSQALPVVFRGDIRGKMKFGGEQRYDLSFVGGIEQPALRFNDSGEQRDDLLAMGGGPGALGKKSGGLIRAD